MIFRQFIHWFLILVIFTIPIIGVTKTPATMVVQANVAIGGISNYSGALDIDVGFYEYDIDDPPVWVESFQDVNVINGAFSILIGETVSLNAEIFGSDQLRIGFTPYVNGEKQSTDFTILKSVPYSFHSEISHRADKITNENLIKLDEVNMRVGINNINPQTTLDVGGTVNATTFIGDGSLITNIQVSDDRLVWLKSPQNQNNIYYASGNVGINTKNPSGLLEVSGNVIASGNLLVGGTIQAAYLKGDGSQITDLNASQISHGTIHNDRLSGHYDNISGLGTITSGEWKGSSIEDLYIDNSLTLINSLITGTNFISGNVIIQGPTIITGNQSLAIISPSWNISAAGEFEAKSFNIGDSILITENVFEVSNVTGYHFRPTGKSGLFIAPSGYIGINTTSPTSEFHVNGGIRLGESTVEEDGVIRFFEDKFQGYRDGEWVQLDYEADFESHALHAEGNLIKNLIYVNSSGNVGIGGIPSQNIHDTLTVSGNVVFRGSSLGQSNGKLNASGNGIRMIWYPQKSSFRAGLVDTDEWDDSNIGMNSYVFGNSGKADAANTTIIGGQTNINSGESAVIIGGYSNVIKPNSNFSVIIGGGASNGGGNEINGAEYSNIIGGQSNLIEGNYSTVMGGDNNTISGDNSVAMGSDITISHDGVFIFSDGLAPVSSTGDHQFLIYATGNVGIGTSPSSNAALTVGGKIKATFFDGDGSLLTNISANKLGGYAPSTTASPNSIYISDASGFLPQNSVSGVSILNESITSADIQNGAITGDKLMPYAITSAKIADGAITSEKIASNAITSDKIQDNAITSKNIMDASIVSSNIAPNSIKSKHIAPLQVTSIKIAEDTIDTTRIVDFTITSQDIAIGAIASINIESNAIQSHHIAVQTIVSENIAPNAIQAQHIAENSISSRNIANDSIHSYHIIDYSILNIHVSNNAIEGIHIADEVITNDRIVDDSITSEKIASFAIEGRHLPNDVIVSRHIADNSVYEHHIASGQIDGTKLADDAISSFNIADNAITETKINNNIIGSNHIIDGTIVSADIGIAAIPNTMLAEDSITYENIAPGGIASFNLQDNSVSSNHIMDYSITSADIKDETIDAALLIQDDSIDSSKIQDGAIENRHIADGAISSQNIADGTLPWEKITTDPIPSSSIQNNSISGTKLMDGTIPGSKIIDNTITSEKLADNSISTNALVGVLGVDKGGTGMTNLGDLAGAIVFGKDEGGTTILDGDKDRFHWDSTNHRLGINTNTPQMSLHVVGDILTTDGGVYFGNSSNSLNFGEEDDGTGFIIIGPEQTPVTPTTKSQGTLKANQVLVSDKVGIGVTPNNELDIGGNAGVAIGSSIAGSATAPANGLLVEGKVGIGTSSPTDQLTVDGAIRAKQIIGEALDNSAGVGIKGIGGNIGIESNGASVGLDVTATQTGIKATSTGSKGISVIINNAQSSDYGVSAQFQQSGSTIVSGGLGALGGDYAASVFGTAPSIANSTNWAGYFDGPVKVAGNLGIGLNVGDSPEANLHIKGSSLIDGQLMSTSQTGTLGGGNTTVDWSASNKYSFSCSNGTSISFTNPTIEGSYVLTLIVTSSSNNCAVLFSDNTIKWEKGISPALSDKINNGDIQIFSFFAQNDGSTTTYYALEGVEFK